MKPHPALSPAVQKKLDLARLKANGQEVDARAISSLVALEDEGSILHALDGVLSSPNVIRTLSRFVTYMAKKEMMLRQRKPVKTEAYSLAAQVQQVLAGTPDVELERVAQLLGSSPLKTEAYSLQAQVQQVLAGTPDVKLERVAQHLGSSPLKTEAYSLQAQVQQVLAGTPDVELERVAQQLGSSPLNAALLSAPENTPVGTLLSPQKRKSWHSPPSDGEDRVVPVKPKRLDFGDTSAQRSRSCSGPPTPEQLHAFGRMDFRKRHLLLKYYSQDCCMENFSAADFKDFQAMGMSALENRLIHKLGKTGKKRTYYEGCEKYKKVHTVYTCDIDKCGRVCSTDLTLEQEGAPLQRAFGDEFILRVKLTAKEDGRECEGSIRRALSEGLSFAMRTYRFFGFKEADRKKRRGIQFDSSSAVNCVFLCLQSEAEADLVNPKFPKFPNMHAARQYMGHWDTEVLLAKRISRFKLCLSKTLQLPIDMSTVNVVLIPDYSCKDDNGAPVYDKNGSRLITTDGCGFISHDLMLKCPPSIYQGKEQAKEPWGGEEECPLLMQMRLFHQGDVYKGVLLLNLKLPPRTILVRESMRKVKRDAKVQSPTFNSLEICGTSRKPKDAKLFQHLVLLLVHGGVPEELIMKWARERLEELATCFKDKKKAFKALAPHIDERLDCEYAVRLILAGMEVEEPLINAALLELQTLQFSELSHCRIPVPGTYYLKGCADPTGTLEAHQVFIIREDPTSPEVLVYKPPGLHPGDIQRFEVVEATPLLKSMIGSAKNVIFFSVHAKRPPVDQMANADLDGDEFLIFENKDILDNYKVSPPWEVRMTKERSPRPREAPADPEAFEREHADICLEASLKPNSTKGQAANAWLVSMDKHISLKCGASHSQFLQKCLDLVDIYFEALDADKTGVKTTGVPSNLKERKKPHFMHIQKDQVADTYVSKSILGQVFDMAKHPLDFGFLPPKVPIEPDPRFEVDGFKPYFATWCNLLDSYNKDMRCALTVDDVALRDQNCQDLTLKYRQILYGGPNLANATKDIDVIKKEASAAYAAGYTRAKMCEQNNWKVTGVRFAWKVAGDALLDILRPPDSWFVCRGVASELFARRKS